MHLIRATYGRLRLRRAAQGPRPGAEVGELHAHPYPGARVAILAGVTICGAAAGVIVAAALFKQEEIIKLSHSRLCRSLHLLLPTTKRAGQVVLKSGTHSRSRATCPSWTGSVFPVSQTRRSVTQALPPANSTWTGGP